MANLAVLVPAKRPWRVQPTIEAFKTTDCDLYFICDAEDHELIEVVDKAKTENIILVIHNGSYAEKINYGCRITNTPFVFLGAEDLEPLEGWYTWATSCLNNEIGVVGINDLLPRARPHATHFLLTRWYADLPAADGKEGPFHAGYHHWYCDDELIGTAKARDAYVYVPQAQMKHLHYSDGSAPDDEVYQRGRWNARIDCHLYQQRAHLWT